jgi:hypothetical protein
LLNASTAADTDADTLAFGVCVLHGEFTDGSFLEIVVAGGVFERVVVEVDSFEMKVVVSVKPEDAVCRAVFGTVGAISVWDGAALLDEMPVFCGQ